MALFGKKVKDAAPASSAELEPDAGGVAVADLPAADDLAADAGHKKSRAARAPKGAKGKVVKNGVAVGLNIGNQFIKAVEVTSKNGELAVTAMGAVPTPAESYTNGNVLSVSALSNAIKDLWRGAGIKSKVAITSVAGTGALVVRVIEVPRMSDGELGDNMKVDADRYIPFPPSEVVMDFKALRELPTDPDAPNMEVLLAAAQREIIDLHVQVVQKAKLDPRAIDVEPIAAARAMQLERRGDNFIDYNEITALVNLGATGTEISILRGDILVFTRVVPGGGNMITQAIAEGLGLPFADAERVKIESADAQAPAGYGAGTAGDFGGSDDFNFGGDDFGGGDLNSAFDDISANPTAAASDDPFDLDFFNQGPKDEPGAGHAQKEGEPGDATPAFNFSGFDFESETSPSSQKPSQDQPLANAPQTDAAPTSFNFGFDDLSNEDLPSVTPAETAANPVSTEKRTAQLEDFASQGFASQELAPPNASSAMGSAFGSESFAMPSAFDFDNFDLPAAAPEDSAIISTPVEAATISPSPPPASFDFGKPTSNPNPPAETAPISFDLENDDIASKSAPDLDNLNAESVSSPSAAPTSFDFALSEPLSVADTATQPNLVEETAPASNSADEFDLDAIFGSSTATSTSAAPDASPSAAPIISLEKESQTFPATEADFVEEFPATAAAGVAANNDDFDLSGIDTGIGGNFSGAFDESNDFSSFGAGLGAGGEGADAAALYGLIYPSLEELAGEVRRSLEFHLGRFPDATISKLVLLGGGARLRNLDVFLTQMLGVPTAVVNPFAHITVQTPKLAPGYASENGPLCAVALGLALRDFVD